jgi:uncharacterized membrane protein (DUF2068 family)
MGFGLVIWGFVVLCILYLINEKFGLIFCIKMGSYMVLVFAAIILPVPVTLFLPKQTNLL